LGLSKTEYFYLTPAELTAKLNGYIYNRDVLSSNFRALFWLQFNQYSKTPKSAESLWKLSIDQNNELTAAEMYERNKNIIEKMGFN
jgi:hypothetical protein